MRIIHVPCLALALLLALLPNPFSGLHAQENVTPVTYGLLLRCGEGLTCVVPGWSGFEGRVTVLAPEDGHRLAGRLFHLASPPSELRAGPVDEIRISCNSATGRVLEGSFPPGVAATVPVATPAPADTSLPSIRADQALARDRIEELFLSGMSDADREWLSDIAVDQGRAIQAADMDGDGSPEVLVEVVLRGSSDASGRFAASHYALVSGPADARSVVFETITPYYATCDHYLYDYSAMSLGMADFTGDGLLEIGFGAACYESERSFTIYRFTGQNLEPLFQPPLYGGC